MRADHGDQAFNHMRGQHDGFLHLKKLLGFDGGEWVFLGVHGAVLQRQIDLGKGDGRGVGTAGLPGGDVGRCIRHTDFQTLDVGTGVEDFLSGGLTRTVVGVSGDLDAGFAAELLGHFLEQRTL